MTETSPNGGKSIAFPTPGEAFDPSEPVPRLRRELATGPEGLSAREASRRLAVHGPNEVRSRARSSLMRDLSAQLAHPLALLLWAAAALAFVAGLGVLGWAILAVIAVNAAFALLQERQAERAVETLARYLPEQAFVVRDGRTQQIEARDLVPGDVILLEEGGKIPADARVTEGGVEVDLSMLTGESAPVERTDAAGRVGAPLIEEPNLVFSGTTCLGGQARATVFATGDRTELGRIAALSQRSRREPSPLEQQVKKVAWLIAAVAVAMGMVFLVVGVAVGLPLTDSLTFAIGLLVANVPEGLLPTITLALAVGVRSLARRGAVVKRLSAVETLGSTDVICTDKTGTLTLNRMRLQAVWTPAHGTSPGPWAAELARTASLCTTVTRTEEGVLQGDPTEKALVEGAADRGMPLDLAERDAERQSLFRFDPRLRLMSVVQGSEGTGPFRVVVKGAPEAVLPQVHAQADVASAREAAESMARKGMRVLAVAGRECPSAEVPSQREDAESELTLLGLVGLYDPPRTEVAEAVRRCHEARIRVLIVTGDNGATAAAVAREAGIGVPRLHVVAASESITDEELDRLLVEDDVEVVFARSSPETKLKVADALRAHGRIVAMTGDGVNDAPALHRAHIGVAMGKSGTDVAREAATMVLTDDDFATIVAAVESGRRVYDNVRKFIVYIFAHTTPEVVPFLVFALSAGAVPLPLTVLQILAIDLGTETLPALALGRERSEPGTMKRPPRPHRQGVISRDMLIRSWGYLGLVSAALVMGAFFYVLWRSGWTPGAPTGDGAALHHAYTVATTATFAGIVTCQVGTAIAARTDHAALRDIGLFTNPLLLAGIAFELVFTAALVYLPPLQDLFGTAALPWDVVALVAAFPFIVWGTDEMRRARRRHSRPDAGSAEPVGPVRSPGRP
ncbi:MULTISPECIES: cation-transporting P-type ATPase [unclassified Streptomyces]|uniref:cation-translocating P-type ATPase n=1 Tax=unclassified Streptomyces TaxID=2593676 RepID=UPI0008238798|nr:MULTISPECIES: cation-transporting P-type ATPase [unclassified Streptomyces]MYT99457.1 HAD-IC family P-type ATPase [Streptomyces sp. SID8350]SCK19915.1 plasma-membrane calcium-translocating P-type ATPase [Streptomyces sp. AmelKG-D3]